MCASEETVLRPPARPCASCPYRRDVPSGIWDESEYEKLPRYDKGSPEPSPQVFMCHQQTGCLCGGWITTHDPIDLIAFRMASLVGIRFDESVYNYHHDVPCFSTGEEAAEHGMAEIDEPGKDARKKIDDICRIHDSLRRKRAP